jgi:uncharacterized protein
MASLLTKLSRLGSVGPATPPAAAPAEETPCAPAPAEPSRGAMLDDLRARMQAVLARAAKREARPVQPLDAPELPFVTHETPLGPLHERVLRLSPAHRMGRIPVSPARAASAEVLAVLALDPALAACDPSRALYLDTETTGLAGGAGTVAFLVGLATWEVGTGGAAQVVVEQLLVRNLGEEAPMLERVRQRIDEASMLVTFNGKAFDLPLLRARFVMARMAAPAEPPHLDLVHVARRLHKPRGVECKLTGLERALLGFERQDDVPSGEVSACYLHFLRTGDTRALLGVIDHNTWDVIAMVALVGLYGGISLTRAAADGADADAQLPAADLVGVARTLKRAGRIEDAFALASRAVDANAGPESLRARAEIAKARGDRARALADFEALAAQITCDRVHLELAKLYEHYAKEPARALEMIARGTAEDAERSLHRARRLTAKHEKESRKKQAELFPRSRRRVS